MEQAMPTQRRLYRDGNMWCAVGLHFRNLAVDPAGFGETQELAITDLKRQTRDNLSLDQFEVGGFCRRCKDWVPEGIEMDGCRDPGCPCN